MAPLPQFTPDAAQQAAAHSSLAEWVDLFLRTAGRNVPLAEGLRRAPRWWVGPCLFPLSALTRCTGPEPTMEYCVASAQWAIRRAGMQAALTAGWKPPPLLVEYRAETHLSIRDGNHRYAALLDSGYTVYWTIIWFNAAHDRTLFLAQYKDDCR